MVVTTVLVAVAACGSSKATSSSSSTSRRSSTTTSTTAAPPASTTPTTAPCAFTGTTGPSQGPAAGTFLLTDVSVVRSGCTDTITFTFRDTPGAGPPPYVIEPVSPPFAQAGSGAPIAVPGSKFLKVKFQPAWILDPEAADAPLTYTGPHAITPAGTAVTRGVVLFDAYEAVVGWIVGLDSAGAYTVSATASPPKVTITVGP